MPRPGDNKFSFDSPHCSFDQAFGYGHTGSTEVVKAMAQHADRETKLNVLMGAQTGFITGHFDNLQTFMATWIPQHLRDIKSDRAEQSDDNWKKDTHAFVGGVATAVIEKSKYPVAAAKVMLQQLDDASRQETLDYLLRHASARKNAVVVEAVLEAGANPDTMGGLAIKNALSGEPVDVLSLRALHKKGADFAKAAGTWDLDKDKINDWDVRLTKEETTAALDGFKQQVQELTSENAALKARLEKLEKKPKAKKDNSPKPPPPAA
jgi:hypothetical protein